MAEPSHILFGTDYPFVKVGGRRSKNCKQTQMSDAERDAIDRGNAIALLPRLGAS